MKWSVLALFVASALVACSSSDTSSGITSVTCPTDSTLTYANFGSAFFTDNCLSCHTTKESPRLDSQAAIKTNSSRILNEAVYSTRMPEDSDLTTAERQMLGEWLACGAP